jgi:hypothetical protein
MNNKHKNTDFTDELSKVMIAQLGEIHDFYRREITRWDMLSDVDAGKPARPNLLHDLKIINKAALLGCPRNWWFHRINSNPKLHRVYLNFLWELNRPLR